MDDIPTPDDDEEDEEEDEECIRMESDDRTGDPDDAAYQEPAGGGGAACLALAVVAMLLERRPWLLPTLRLRMCERPAVAPRVASTRSLDNCRRCRRSLARDCRDEPVTATATASASSSLMNECMNE